jgi:N-acyl homoserine lactone hydrolase
LPDSGTLVLPFDAGDLQENFDRECLPGESCDNEAALRAIRRINSIVRDGASCLLFHDPVAIQRIKLCPEFYA